MRKKCRHSKDNKVDEKKIYNSNKSTKKIQQFHRFITLTFVYSSTCFGRFLAHHQELTTALAASGF